MAAVAGAAVPIDRFLIKWKTEKLVMIPFRDGAAILANRFPAHRFPAKPK